MRSIAVAQLIEPPRAAPAHVSPVVAHRVLEHREHHVLARWLRIEVTEALGVTRTEKHIERPGLSDVEHLGMVIGVIEAAISYLPVLDQVDAQARAARHDEGARLARRDDEVGERPGSRHAAGSDFSSLVGSGARFSSASQYAS